MINNHHIDPLTTKDLVFLSKLDTENKLKQVKMRNTHKNKQKDMRRKLLRKFRIS